MSITTIIAANLIGILSFQLQFYLDKMFGMVSTENRVEGVSQEEAQRLPSQQKNNEKKQHVVYPRSARAKNYKGMKSID